MAAVRQDASESLEIIDATLDAQQSLGAIESATKATIKSVSAAFAGPILILWGIITILGYIGTYFWLDYAWKIWIGLSGAGNIGMFLICRKQFTQGLPTRVDNARQMGFQIAGFWVVIFVFLTIWLNLMKPYSGLQLNAFIITVIAFAYIQIGIFTKGSRFMILLGIAMALLTLIGVYILPHTYYCLWMAGTVGGSILLTGLYFQLKARS